MATSDVRDALLRLREQIPGLLGEEDWNAVRESATARFEELEDARTPAEQQVAIDALLAVLMPYPVLAEPLRRALRGSGTRGQVTDGGRRGQQPRGLEPRDAYDGGGRGEQPRALEPRDADDDADRGIGGIGEPDVVGNERTLRRWPHMDVDHPDPVPGGTELQVSVYVDTSAPRIGEIAESLVVPEAAEIRIRVVLVASERHFEVGGAATGWIAIRGGEARSTTATFRLRVAAGVEGPGEITAFLVHEGRPAGAVTRSVSVGAAARGLLARSAREPLGTDAAIRADLAARRPDLTVQIMTVPNTGRKRYRCSVSTPHLPQYAEGIEQDWDLPEETKDFVFGYMGGFVEPGAGNHARHAALVGAGLDLFEAAPENFHEVYWALRGAGLPLDSIYVVSQEPFVPWELMIPQRPGEEDDVPIGVSSAVGRWVHEKHVSPRQMKEIASSYVLAPTYRGRDRLDFAVDEARYVVETFAGRQITPVSLERIETVLREQGGADLLHLICHGYDDAEGRGQVIQLDPEERLYDRQLRGMQSLRQALAQTQPMVFLNACEVGRQTPALVGTGGFASRFIALGATAVVAPIWSVKDEVAAQVARAFYSEVTAHPERPFAAVLRDIRRRAYESPEAEDSWAAYCFYGDPLSALAG